MDETISAEATHLPSVATVKLPVSVDEALRQWAEYQELTRKLLNDNDYQRLGGKKFKKKSAWRKYARAFNISDRVTFEHIERDEQGFPIFARIRVEATHPSGRVAEADHECHRSERCCPAARLEHCDSKGRGGHKCCVEGCDGRKHWPHPGDIAATALTRSKNRAISDLIGAGEVSAEEMEREERSEPARKPELASVTVPETEPSITVAQRHQLLVAWRAAGHKDEDVLRWFQARGIENRKEILQARFNSILGRLSNKTSLSEPEPNEDQQEPAPPPIETDDIPF